ncbi:MAG TPA: T9SS type A sorting domain-containing protein [Saprospiraceae bacterium]|nr:T9SS type A sorting domain-containing protein [Saprospiraceae bacterium]
MQRFPLFLYSLFFFLFFLSVNQQAFGQSRPLIELEVGTVAGAPGDTVCIPVTVKNFKQVVSASFGIFSQELYGEIVSIDYHPALLEEGDVALFPQASRPGFSEFIFEIFTGEGRSISLADDAILLEYCMVIESYHGASPFNYASPVYITKEVGFYPEVQVLTKENTRQEALLHLISGKVNITNQPEQLVLDITLNSELGCGEELLTVEAQPQGGVPPYTYLFATFPGLTPEFRLTTMDSVLKLGENLSTHGIYQVAVEDATGQFALSHFYYYGGNDGLGGDQQGLPLPEVEAIIQSPNCGGAVSGGSIQLRPASGMDNSFSYEWNTAALTDKIDDVPPGAYSVTITDDQTGCQNILHYDLSEEGSLSINTQEGSVFCATDSTEVGFTNLDSYPNIQFRWETGDSTALAKLPPGVYAVTVTDRFCEEVRQVEVVHAGEPMVLDEDQFDLIMEPYSCENNVARVGVVQLDSTRNYGFSWAHDASIRDSAIEVSGFTGDLVLTITTEGACPIRVPFSVESPQPPNTITAFSEFMGCETGEYRSGLVVPDNIDADALSYNWSTGDTSRTVILPPNQQHSLTLTYADYCFQEYDFSTFDQPDLPVTLKTDTLSCVQDTAFIGILNAEAFSGRTYAWSTTDTTAMTSVSEAGRYTVSVTDGFCSSDFTIDVAFISGPPTLDTNQFERIEQGFNCLNAQGQIGVVQLMAERTYTYEWSHDFSLENPIISVSDPGNYFLNIQGDSGCTYEVAFRLEPPTPPDDAFSFIPLDSADCLADELTIGLDYGTVSDTTVYSYLWNTLDTTRTITVPRDEPYRLVVTYGQDERCTKTYNFNTIFESSGFNLDVQYDTVFCVGDRARIGLLGTEAYPNLTFKWSNGDTTPFTEVLPERYYSVTIAEGYCQQVERIYVPFVNREQPLDPDKFQTVYEPFACEQGPARVGVEQLVEGEYEFRWSHDEYFYEPIAEVDQPGRYILEIIEEGACPVEVSFFLSEPDIIINPELVSEYTSCAEDTYQLGVVLGDSTDYSFQWSTGQTTSQIVAPAGPTYKLTVTYSDNELCSRSFDFATESYALEASVKFQTCTISDNCEAVSLVRVSPGFAYTPVEYVWSDGTQRADNGSLVEFQFPANLGMLDLYVKDAKGCTDTLRNIELGCGIEKQFVADNFMPQYIECVPDSLATDQLQAVLFTEVYSNFATLPPYRFEWSNGQEDTSYFRSGQLLSDLTDVNANVVDFTGERYVASFTEDAQLYGCGTTSSTKFLAPTIIVEPGESFTYPIYVKDHKGLESGLFTVRWDPCLLNADSSRLIRADGEEYVFEGSYLELGVEEVGYFNSESSPTNDSTLIAILYFTAREDVSGISPFLFALNEPPVFAEANPNNGIIPIHSSITVADPEDLVTPGDTDEDGAVGHKDLLNIGLGYATQGPDRRSVDVSRQAFGFSWNEDLPRSQTNYKNIDCDGDGFISEVDLTAINQNWTYDRPLTTGEVHLGAPELFIRRDTLVAAEELRVPLELGLSFDAVDRMHGIAFSIGYDPTVVDEESLAFEPGQSWLLPEETPLSMVRLDTQLHLLRVALTNTDRIDRAGYGPIGHLRFKLKDVQQEVTFEFGDVLALDAAEGMVPVNGSTSTVFISNTSTNTQKAALEQAIKVYPQPVGDWLYLDYPVGRIQTYSICDLSGRNISGTNPIDFRINLAGWPPGMYLLQLHTDSGLIHKKIMKVNP